MYIVVYLKERLSVGPVLAGGIMEETGEAELSVVGGDLFSKAFTALGEDMEEMRVSGRSEGKERGGEGEREERERERECV